MPVAFSNYSLTMALVKGVDELEMESRRLVINERGWSDPRSSDCSCASSRAGQPFEVLHRHNGIIRSPVIPLQTAEAERAWFTSRRLWHAVWTFSGRRLGTWGRESSHGLLFALERSISEGPATFLATTSSSRTKTWSAPGSGPPFWR